jgi:hypothetical protein
VNESGESRARSCAKLPLGVYYPFDIFCPRALISIQVIFITMFLATLLYNSTIQDWIQGRKCDISRSPSNTM